MIEIYNATEPQSQAARQAVAAVFKHFKIKETDADVEVSFVSAEEIKELNKETREIDEVTDVLSFQNLEISFPFRKKDYPDDCNPETGAVILGEICICAERAAEQAAEYGHGIEREYTFLACHGTLHLLGFDHLEQADEEKMFSLQHEIIGSADAPKDLSSFSKLEPKISDEDETVETNAKAKKVNKKTEAVNLETVADSDEDETVETNAKAKKVNKKTEAVNLETVADELDSNNSESLLKAGFIAVLGKPNAGKSTLVNALVGEKVSIVSWKPQTTRNSILGIFNDNDAQIVFIDTPGLHVPQNTLGKYMMHGVTAALNETDFVLYVVDCERGLREEDVTNIKRYLQSDKTVTVAVNKIDHVQRERVLDILAALNDIKELFAVVPVSALKVKNLDRLSLVLKQMLPNATQRMFDAELYTTQSMRFLAAETIREKALRLLDEEIPYGIGVNINKYEYRENGILDIDADVVLENKNHKPIVLGKGGAMIKKISTYARQDLEAITGDKIFLTLWVRVKEAWRDSTPILNEMGYIKKKNDII